MLVLGVLPAILVLGDSIIERTSFKLRHIERKAPVERTGTMKLSGHVHGYVCGIVDGEFEGTLHGDLNAKLSTDPEQIEGGSDDE